MTTIGGGTLTLAGTNSYTGGTTVGGVGALVVASTAALPGYNLTSKVAVGGSGTLTVLAGGSGWTASNVNSLVGSNGSGFASGSALGIDTTSATSNFSYGYAISGGMGLTKFGPNALILTASNVYTGATNITAGTLQLGTATSGSDGSLSGVGGIIDKAALVFDLYGSQTYSGVISGTGSLTKIGGGSLTLSNSSTFSGPTTISSGSLVLGNGNALQSSTVTAPAAGLVFANSGGYTFGALSGSGNLSLQSGTAAVALNVGGNNASTVYSGAMTGSGSLTKAGGGTLTLTGPNTFSGGVTVTGGMLTVASSGALTTGSGNNLYVGYSSPVGMTIQDSATVNVGGELEVNVQATAPANPSTLTITGGSLHVAGQTIIGGAQALTGPNTTSAAVYQSGGTATLSGQTTVGDNGTATSLYDINGGVLNVTGSGDLRVGGASGGQGNGLLNIQGSAVVSVSGGLWIGQDVTRATGGTVSLSSGTLNVTGNLTLGTNNSGGGGIALFSRSGGAMSVTGNLVVDGNATLLLDGTTGTVATIFGGFNRNSPGTLVVVPQTGNLSTSEAVLFTTAPGLTHNILGPGEVVEASGSNTVGDYLSTTATTLGGHAYYQLTTLSASNYDTNFSQPSNTVLENVTTATTLTGNTTVYVMKTSGTTTLTGQTLWVYSGGMIFNGGEVIGGTVGFGSGPSQYATPLIYAGSSTAGTIASALSSSLQLVKFGPGTLVLAGNSSNTLSDGVCVTAGTLNVQNSGALGEPGTSTVVAAGASLQLQNNVSLGNVPITLNGAGAGGGALQNVSGNNSLGGPITLASNSEINVQAGTLTLTGAVLTPTVQSYSLTKAGSGTLVLAGTSGSAFPSQVTVANGALLVQNSAALGPGGSGAVAVNAGATLQLQNGVAIPAVPLTLNGTGANNNGAMENVQARTPTPAI